MFKRSEEALPLEQDFGYPEEVFKAYPDSDDQIKQEMNDENYDRPCSALKHWNRTVNCISAAWSQSQSYLGKCIIFTSLVQCNCDIISNSCKPVHAVLTVRCNIAISFVGCAWRQTYCTPEESLACFDLVACML